MCKMMMKRSPRSSLRRSKKQVTFNETTNTKQIIQHHHHRHDYSDHDDVDDVGDVIPPPSPPSNEEYWYQEEDYQRMKDECKQLAETMSSCFHNDVLRSSGLETSAAKRERCCTVSDIQWIVLDEQQQQQQQKHKGRHSHHQGGGNNAAVVVDVDDHHPQQQHHDDDNDSIATITSSLTKEHVNDAYKRGIITRQEVLFDTLERQYNETHHDHDHADDEEEEMMMIAATKPRSPDSSPPPPLREAVMEQSWSSINPEGEELDGSTQSLLLKSPLPRAA